MHEVLYGSGRCLAAVRGLVFDPGEQVEGYSNFLWVALQALAIRRGGDPEAVMLWLGWLSSFELAWLTCLLFARHGLPRNPGAATLIGVATMRCPVLVSWAGSGMETRLYAALVFAAGFRMRFGAYFVMRALHFGHLFPNTFYAKLDYGSLALLQRGLHYELDFALGAAPVAALARRGAPEPGHEKLDVDLVLSRRPDYLLVLETPTKEPVASGDVADEACGAFRNRVSPD